VAEQPGLGFAELLRQLRAEARLTQEELAEAAGLSPRSVSDLERGIHRTAHKDTAGLLAGALSVALTAAVYEVAAGTGASPVDAATGFRASAAFLACVAVAATALLPTLALVIGIRARRRLFLDAGLVAFALSLVTLRAYVHIANLWVVLSGAGALLVLISLALHRWLERGEEEERRGFTAAPLFSDETAFRAVELVPVLAAHAPAAKPVEEAGFMGGGGSFGGGGAGGSF